MNRNKKHTLNLLRVPSLLTTAEPVEYIVAKKVQSEKYPAALRASCSSRKPLISQKIETF